MAIAVPIQRTWNVGDKVSAAMLNANVRDAVTFMLNRPTATISQNAAQSIPNTTWAAITFDTTAVDTYAGHSTTVNPSRYVAPVTGWYLVRGTVAFNGNATGARVVAVAVNGVQGMQVQVAPTAASANIVQVVNYVYVVAGAYIEIQANQASGAALSTYGSKYSSMQIDWVHA